MTLLNPRSLLYPHLKPREPVVPCATPQALLQVGPSLVCAELMRPISARGEIVRWSVRPAELPVAGEHYLWGFRLIQRRRVGDMRAFLRPKNCTPGIGITRTRAQLAEFYGHGAAGS